MSNLKYQNISRRLSLEGWNHYKGTNRAEVLISKSEYYEIKKENKVFRDYWKQERARLRSK